MYIDCAVPSSKIPGQHVYTYFAQQSIHPGTLVLVPFGKQEVPALVIASKPTTSVKHVLPVIKLLFPTPIVTKEQLALFQKMADYYHCSLSQVIGLTVPDFPVKMRKTLLQQSQRRVPQQLIVVPTVERLAALKRQLKQRQKAFLEYHSDLTPTQRAQAYLQVLHGQVQIIISTRIGLFLPFPHLQQITIYDEHDWSYKENRLPSYHAIDIAIFLTELTSTTVTIIDPCPRVQTLYHLHNAKPRIIFKPPPQKTTSTQVKLIDCTQEKQRYDKTNISIILSDAILEAVAARKTILLFNPRKNDLYETSNLRQTIVEVNTMLKLAGIHHGQWHQEKDGSITTFRFEDKTLITVATTKILYRYPISTYDVIGVINTDTLLNIPEFRAHERTYAILTHLRRLLKPLGTIYIQTDQPDNLTLQAFRKSQYRQFVKTELTDRKDLGYPPFQELLLLSYTAKTQATAHNQATALMTKLEPQAQALQIESVGPFVALHNPGEIRILLKSTDRSALLTLLDDIPRIWRVTFDPEQVLG